MIIYYFPYDNSTVTVATNLLLRSSMLFSNNIYSSNKEDENFIDYIKDKHLIFDYMGNNRIINNIFNFCIDNEITIIWVLRKEYLRDLNDILSSNKIKSFDISNSPQKFIDNYYIDIIDNKIDQILL